jgi:hypothetical protein
VTVSRPRSETEFHELLRSVDEATHAEWPPDFDERQARAKFMRLVEATVREYGTSVRYEAGFPLIQDASFFGDLTIPAEATRSGVEIEIRTSNFGELATVTLADRDLWDDPTAVSALLDEDDLRTVERLLSESGYEYVPLPLLRREYDGANHALKELYAAEGRRLSWWERYFDWL